MPQSKTIEPGYGVRNWKGDAGKMQETGGFSSTDQYNKEMQKRKKTCGKN
jgi:hypothetical protein